MDIVLAGCGGLIGGPLIDGLKGRGFRPKRLVRPSSQTQNQDTTISWDPGTGQLNGEDLEGCHGVFCMGGVNIADRAWTQSFKREMRESRLKTTDLLSRTLASLANPPKVMICASAIGIYGNRGADIMDEAQAPGDDFLATLVKDWEAAAQPAKDAGIRVVHARIGVVLSKEGGALRKMLTPFKLGLGGRVGPGTQYMSWISLDDVVAALIYCLENEQVEGPVNMVAPHPVTNKSFSKQLAKSLRRPSLIPVPGFAISLGLGEMGRSLLLSSTRVSSQKILDKGFKFQHPDLATALSCLLK